VDAQQLGKLTSAHCQRLKISGLSQSFQGNDSPLEFANQDIQGARLRGSLGVAVGSHGWKRANLLHDPSSDLRGGPQTNDPRDRFCDHTGHYD
jgi:hypothetical protein